MGNLGAAIAESLIGSGLDASETLAEEASISSITLFVALLCACMVIGHLLEKNRWINESITALVVGLCTGVIILLISGANGSRIIEFNKELFFIYLLPPIIFNAGFQVRKKLFFRNFVTINLFGAVGTLISFFIISFGAKQLFGMLDISALEARDFFAIGAIFSATDSVCTLQVLNQDETPLLYSVVFGEGVVNDATSIVLFNVIQKFDLSQVDSKVFLVFVSKFLSLFITSTLLGVIIGLLSAYMIKKLKIGRQSTDREVALMMLMAYLSYVMAELFDLSGILAVFFCGIVMSHYTWHNVTLKSRVTTKHAFATLSYIAETFIFIYVGMDAFDIEKWKLVTNSPGKTAGVSAILLGIVLVGRASSVFPLSFLSNCTKKSQRDRIDFRQQVVIWWAGLMRGAVSMALAYNQFSRSGHTQIPGYAIMITSTIIVVLFSTVVFGLFTKPLVRYLLPASGHLSNTWSSEPSLTLPLLANRQESETETDSSIVSCPFSLVQAVQYYWGRFDEAVMRSVFGGKQSSPYFPASPKDARVLVTAYDKLTITRSKDDAVLS